MKRVAVILAAVFVALVAFQNCGSVGDGFTGRKLGAPISSAGGGDGYGGKVYVEVAAAGAKCEGNPYRARIDVDSLKGTNLVKDACKILPPRPVAVESDPKNPDNVVYNGRVFEPAQRFFAYGGFETTLDKLKIWEGDPGTSFQHINEAAHSGEKGLRLHKTAIEVYPENLPILDPSRKYRMSFWAKVVNFSPGTATWQHPFLTFRSSRVDANGVIADGRYVHIDIKGAAWTRYDVIIEPVEPPGSTWTYGFNLSSSWDTDNVVDIDDFTIEELPCPNGCAGPNPSASTYPWAADLARPAISNLFPRGKFDQAADLPLLSSGLAVASSTNAKHAGAGGIRVSGAGSMLYFSNHPDSPAANRFPTLDPNKKYRISCWARVVSLGTGDAPLIGVRYESRSNENFSTLRGGFVFEMTVLSTDWKRYEAIIEPRAHPGEWFHYDFYFNPLFNTADIDELRLEEL